MGNMYRDIEEGEFIAARLSNLSTQIQEPNNERRWRLSYLKVCI